ncbi:MAG: PQQ-dependent sugar dehydrogenase [Pseudomonadota bacterium]
MSQIAHAIIVATLLAAAFALSALAADEVPYDELPFDIEIVANMEEPWALAVLDEDRLLITEKPGSLKLVSANGEVSEIKGLPEVAYGGQGGLGDIVLSPDFDETGRVYLSYAEEEDNKRGAVVATAILQLSDDGGRLTDFEVLWRQSPKVSGRGHYGHRIAFGPEGKLWISSGERQKFDPAQDMDGNLGKIIRLNPDGSIPQDNPFYERGGVTAEIWSLGHRNPLGLAFDGSNQLWVVEMGPAHGDELNLVLRGENYGYPIVSNGNHYNGKEIPNHDTRPEFEAPKVYWVPAISPSSLMFYDGDVFADWQGDAFIGGMSFPGLVRIEFDGENAREAARYSMDARIRDIAQAADGTLWVIEDERGSSKGRLLRLSPAT